MYIIPFDKTLHHSTKRAIDTNSIFPILLVLLMFGLPDQLIGLVCWFVLPSLLWPSCGFLSNNKRGKKSPFPKAYYHLPNSTKKIKNKKSEKPKTNIIRNRDGYFFHSPESPSLATHYFHLSGGPWNHVSIIDFQVSRTLYALYGIMKFDSSM